MHCRPRILLLCLAAIALVFLLPRLGVDVAGSGLLLTALMVGCCVLPMLMSVRGKDGGCCGKDTPGAAEPDKGGEKGKRTPSCH